MSDEKREILRAHYKSITMAIDADTNAPAEFKTIAHSLAFALFGLVNDINRIADAVEALIDIKEGETR